MAERILLPEWRDENEATRFPFVEAATLTSDDDQLLPEGTFLDAILHVIGASAGLYLSRVTLAGGVVTLSIGDSRTAIVATGSFNQAAPPSLINLTDLQGRPAGTLVSEPTRLAPLAAWGVGEHRLSRRAAEFVPAVCVPCPDAGLSGIRVGNRTMTGDVWLVGAEGVVLSDTAATPLTACSPATRAGIRIDVVGDPLFRRRLCASGGEFIGPRPIRQIRFIGPDFDYTCYGDSWGDIRIVVGSALVTDPALRIHSTEDGLKFESAAGLKSPATGRA